MLKMVLAAVMAATLASTPTKTERVSQQNGIEIITDLATNITPNVCKVQAKRFESSWPELGQMSQAARQAFLRNREERCVQELKDRFGMASVT